MKEKLIHDFQDIFGVGGEIRAFFAPGRVNLIGEHTDYNGGHVFPCALTIGTYAVARRRGDRVCRFYSENFPDLGVLTAPLDGLSKNPDLDWANYPLGVVWSFGEKGLPIESGFDLLLFGNIPNASGLSSSASVEIVTGVMLRSLFGIDVTNTELALLGQYAENRFVGMNCGIMDQFVIANGKEDCAVFLDTSTLKFEYAPVVLSTQKIVIVNTNKRRGLKDSKYNERRAECEGALRDLQTKLPIRNLCDLSREEFDANAYLISSEVRKKRARHAVYENCRTLDAVQALNAGDLAMFGRLMNASHVSLRDDYEVTGVELDTIAEAAWTQRGVIGARMTGAGFGGCAVSIVENDAVDDFISNVGRSYRQKIGYDASFYTVSIGGCGREL